MEEVVNQSRIVVRKETVPKEVSLHQIEAKFNNQVIQIDNMFKEDGYIVANVNKIALIPDKIRRFEKLIDKHGSLFYEVVFKN